MKTTVVSLQSSSLVYQFRFNEKTEEKTNWLCIRALQQMRISKSDCGRR